MDWWRLRDLHFVEKKRSAGARGIRPRLPEVFGRGLAMLLDLLNPEKIILGGLGMRIADALVGPAVEVMRSEALPEAFAALRKRKIAA